VNKCPETQYCKENVTVCCICGSRTLQRVCGVSTSSPDVFLQLDCDDSCATKLRNLKLAQAFSIKPELSGDVKGRDVNWPEALVRTAVHFKQVVLSTELKLAELLANPTERFYYFPR
jgi:hypothetical protein